MKVRNNIWLIAWSGWWVFVNYIQPAKQGSLNFVLRPCLQIVNDHNSKKSVKYECC